MPRSYGTTNAAPYASAPAVGLAGDTYFNTVNKNFWLSDGTQWLSVAPTIWGSAWGCIAYAEATGAQSGIGSTATDITGATVTFTAVAGRLYHIIGNAHFVQNTSAGVGNLYVTDGSNNTLDSSGFNLAASTFLSQTVQKRITFTAGSVTVKLRANTNAGTLQMNQSANAPTTIIVNDVGPASGAGVGVGAGFPVIGARITRNVDQTFTGGAWATLVFTTTVAEQLLPGTSTTYNSGGALVIPPGHAGRYWIGFHGRWDGSGSGSNPTALITVNGNGIVRDSPSTVPTAYMDMHCSTIWDLNDGDIIRVQMYNGVTRAVSYVPGGSGTDPPGPMLECWRLSNTKGDAGGAGGIIANGLATVTANQSAASTASPGTAITGASCAVTTLANRRYRITWTGHGYADAGVSGASVVFAINRDGTQIQGRACSPAVNAASEVSVVIIDAPSAGAHTYTVNMWRGVGSGGCNNAGSATQPCQLIVEDIGSTTP